MAVATMPTTTGNNDRELLTIFDARSLAAAQGNMILVSTSIPLLLTCSLLVLPLLIPLYFYFSRARVLRIYLDTLAVG